MQLIGTYSQVWNIHDGCDFDHSDEDGNLTILMKMTAVWAIKKILTGRLWEGEKGFAQAEEEAKQPVGADQEEGERERQRDDWQGQRYYKGAEKDGKQWRKERKSGVKRGQGKNKSNARIVKSTD